MKRSPFLLSLLFLSAFEAGALTWKKEPSVTFDAAAGPWLISFELNEPADVEVAVLGADGKVVRHLAAGVLGKETPPPPPLRAGLAQAVAWDGKDDYGLAVVEPAGVGKDALRAENCSFRVRAGMSVKLERIVGGDPYAWYSAEMGQGDHAAWRITGLEAKSDGTVYVLGNANNYGPPALRAYTADGTYLRTVYPPPAGKPFPAVQGWGAVLRPDGTYTFLYKDLSSPALSTTIIAGTRGRIDRLIPSPERDSLLLEDNLALMKVGSDGTIPPEPLLRHPLIVGSDEPPERPMPRRSTLGGQMHACLAPDGRHLYLSGFFGATLDERGRRNGVETEGFWRDGQVFKVDLSNGTAEVFFALDPKTLLADMEARSRSPIGDARYGNYAALQGVACDAQGRVFVCDRQNARVLVLNASGKILREIPCQYPDAVACSPSSRTLYVTTRVGHYHGKGELKLLRFDDWQTTAAPVTSLTLCAVHHYSEPTHLIAVEHRGAVYVWIAYTALPVRVYRDDGRGMELVKDFYEVSTQRALDLQHFVVDSSTEILYVADGFGSCFRIADWRSPRFVRCVREGGTPVVANDIAVDVRRGLIYTHGHMGQVLRYRFAGEFFEPAPVGENLGNAVTPRICNDWRIGLGQGFRGMAVAPDGGLATLGALEAGADYSGPLHWFRADPHAAPWRPLFFAKPGRCRSAGVRFDLQGNLYVGIADGKVGHVPAGFAKDRLFLESLGRIYKFAPTGSLDSGNLFPVEPEQPEKIYDVNYGAIGPNFSRTPRFAVDGFGRIYYPTSLEPRVSVVDNAGNPILSFGVYGNRDSCGGLEGDFVHTADIPLAWPNCVDATEDFIYVSDIVNIRLLRLRKKFELETVVHLPQGGMGRNATP